MAGSGANRLTVDTLTVREAASLLGVRDSAVYRYISSGKLAATRTTRGYELTKGDVEAFRRPTGNTRGTPHKPEAVEHALRLLTQGINDEEAAKLAGITGRALRKHLKQRGLTTTQLRPGPRSYKGTVDFEAKGSRKTHPCVYCQKPTMQRGAVCGRWECRKKLWESFTPEERKRRLKKRGMDDDKRREGDEAAYNEQVDDRHDLHVLIERSDFEVLRLEATRRQWSISRLVCETLRDAGIIPGKDPG